MSAAKSKQQGMLIMILAEGCGHCTALKALIPDIVKKLPNNSLAQLKTSLFSATNANVLYRNVFGRDPITDIQKFADDGYPCILFEYSNGDISKFQGSRSVESIVGFFNKCNGSMSSKLENKGTLVRRNSIEL